MNDLFANRRQSREILDHAFIPDFIRGAVYTSLGLTQAIAGLHDILAEQVLSELIRLKTTKVIELGSGSGSSLKHLATCAKRMHETLNISFCLTDKFPSVTLWKNSIEHTANISMREQPLSFVDVLQIHDETKEEEKTLLIISALHHLNDSELQQFLRENERLGANIIVVEPLERKISHAALSVAGTFVGVLTPFMKKLSLKKRLQQFLVYYSGVGLFIQGYDGVLSTLRQRTKKELLQLAAPFSFHVTQRTHLGRFATYSMTTYQKKPLKDELP